MEISPYALLRLLGASCFLGIVLGVFHDVNRMIRVLCGAHDVSFRLRSLYEKPLPLIRRPLRLPKEGGLRRGILGTLIFFQDFALCVVAAVGTVLTLYAYNSGRFRWFCPVAMGIGFLLYHFTVGRLVMAVSEWIVFLLKASFLVIGSLLARPFVEIGRFFVKKLKKSVAFFVNLIAKNTKKLYNKNRKKKLMEQARKGFLP